MSQATENLPSYLKRFCVEQDYSSYTARDQATWRCIMKQSCDYFSKHAVDEYMEGLETTGITIDSIPKISDMDKKLAAFNYGAVGVVGFIPPAIFLEFQARGVMPIATDIRTLEHIGYTPAPDIVHEAAGHVPVVASADYREYLSHYGQIANRALISSEDIRCYEAIRTLSDIKENPDTEPHEIEEANQKLKEATERVSFVSESTKVSRMGWWSIEYGLAGEIGKELKIYGAGLLSSVSESQNCLSDQVKKIPMTVDCVNYGFDITEQQPQLFVTPSLKALKECLKELEGSFSFKTGGVKAVEESKRCQTVNTIELDSGAQFCGLVEYYLSEGDRLDFVKLSGPVQICFKEKVLPGQSCKQHPEGFSTPIGRFAKYPDVSPASLSEADLNEIGLKKGSKTKLEMTNGYVISGKLFDITFRDGRLLMLHWSDARVTRGEEVFFQPEWGTFDQAVGERVTSVFSGPGDRESYGSYDIGFASTNPGRVSPYSDKELSVIDLYQQIRNGREKTLSWEQIVSIGKKISDNEEWLLKLEWMELAKKSFPDEAEGCDIWNQFLRDLEDEKKAPMANRCLRIYLND